MNAEENTMKSAMESMIEWLEQNHPDAVPGPETTGHFFMKEKIDQQMAYNAGFSKAKSIYLDGE
jgi:carbamoylphosphate synthase small subunit